METGNVEATPTDEAPGNAEATPTTEATDPVSPVEESPGEDDSGEAPPTSEDGPESINLDDPNLYSQPLVQTYRTSLETTFSATAADGSTVNGAVYVDGETDVDANATNLVFQLEGNPVLESGGDTLVYAQIADVVYIVVPDMDCISSSDDTMEDPFEIFLDTTGDLNGEAYRILPDENVNGVDVYVFEITMENLVSLSTEISELKEGRIYVAKDGLYVVRMRFVAVGTNEFLSGSPSLEGDEYYELNYYDFNQPMEEIVPPAGCTDLGSDDIEATYPLPDDAFDITEIPGMILFYTNLTLEEIADFYQAEMTALGCSAGQEIGNSEGMLITFTGCPSGTVQFIIAVDPVSGSQQVSIISEP
jgi:hypothetical protein